MGSLFTTEYNEQIEKEINDSLCILNLDARILSLQAIVVSENSRYREIIDDIIIDTKSKPRW